MNDIITITYISLRGHKSAPSYFVDLKQSEEKWTEHWDPWTDTLTKGEDETFTDRYHNVYKFGKDVEPSAITDMLSHMS